MVPEVRKEENLTILDPLQNYCTRMKQLQQLRKNRTFCDVVLQVDSTEIHAHRSVLACASPYLFELFTADDEIKTASEEKLIYKLNGGFDKDSVEKLVSYAYTGELEVPTSLTRSVYIAANKLKMENIAKACGEHLLASLTPESCLGVRALPGIASNLMLSKVDEYIQKQTDLLQVTKETLGVPKILLNVIHNTKDESNITCRALSTLSLEWVKKQMEEEEFTLSMLTEKTHLLYLNLDNSLHDCADIQTGSANDTEIVQDYKKISRKLSQPNMKIRRKVSGVQPAKPRMMLFSRSISDNDDELVDGNWKLIAHSKVTEISLVAIVSLNNSVAVLSIQQQLNLPNNEDEFATSRPPSVEKIDSYTLIPHMSLNKCASGVGTLNGRLIACGGYDSSQCLTEVEAYDPQTNSWTDYPPMIQARGRFDLTVLNGRAYAVGGCNGVRELDSVEVLNGDELKWESAAPLPLARSNTGVCSLNGKVFCIGGWNGQYGIKQCDEYDPVTGKWITIAPLHTGRYQAGVAAFQGKVYAVGGCDSWNCLSTVEVFDPQQEVWRHAAPMTTPRRGCGLAILNNKLCVVGGSDGTQSLCSTEIYDPETNTWAAGPNMTTCRANVGVAVLNDRLYAVGGFSGKSFLNSVEFLDPQTQEWTNFTPKPEFLKKTESGGVEVGVVVEGDESKLKGNDSKVIPIVSEDVKLNKSENGYDCSTPIISEGCNKENSVVEADRISLDAVEYDESGVKADTDDSHSDFHSDTHSDSHSDGQPDSQSDSEIILKEDNTKKSNKNNLSDVSKFAALVQ